MKWAVSLVIVMVALIFLGGLCGYVWVNILTLSPPRDYNQLGACIKWHTSSRELHLTILYLFIVLFHDDFSLSITVLCNLYSIYRLIPIGSSETSQL